MTIPFPPNRKKISGVCALAVLALVLFSAGCTMQKQQQAKPIYVTVAQADSSHLTLTYPGSTETGTLLELEATVTDSAGKTQTKSIGDRYSTTPLKWGATLPLAGSFGGNDHVVVIGYFMDNSRTVMLDTTI